MITVYNSRQSAGIAPAREILVDKIVKTYKEADFLDRNKIIVLTPSQDTFQVERELIERIGEGGLLGLRVIDFSELLHQVVEEARTDCEFVDEHGRLMLMQKSLNDVKDDLTIYQNSVDKRGFAEQVISQISQFKSAEISPETLNESSETFGESLLSDKLKDLSQIYSVFTSNLGENRLDEDDYKVFALSLIPGSNVLTGAKIFLLDYSDLEYSIIQFLTRAEEVADSIDIALISDRNTMIKDATTFVASNKTIDTLIRTANESHVPVQSESFPVEHSGALGKVASDLFSYQPREFKEKSEQVSLYRTSDPWDEIVHIAQLIALENQKGRSYSKIALVMSDAATYKDNIKRIFGEYDIPIFIDDNHEVIDNHFIQSILFALDAVDSDFKNADVLSYVKSDFSGLSNDEADIFENYIHEAGIEPWEYKKPFKRVPPSYERPDNRLNADDPINILRERVYNSLKLLKSDEEQSSYNTHIKRLLNFLKHQKAQQILEEISERVAKEESQEIALRYRQIWNILVEVLDQMKETLGEDLATFSEFVEVFRTGLASYEIGVIPEDKDAVIIATLERTKLPEIESIYFVGLNEGLIPKVKFSEDLLSEHDKERFEKLFENGLETWSREYELRLEELNFYTLITKAKKRLTFSYSYYDASGAPLLPSRYVDTLESIFGQNLYKNFPPVFNLIEPKRVEAVLESQNPRDAVVQKTKRIVRDWFLEHDEKLERYHLYPRESQMFLEKTIGDFNASRLYQRHDNLIRVSPSRLELFANCPFRHFINYGLRPREREEYEVKSFHTGIVVHEIFEKFIKSIKERTGDDSEAFLTEVKAYLNDRERLEEDSDKVFNEVFDELEEAQRYEHSAASRYLKKKIKRMVYSSLQMLLEQIERSHFIPEFLEEPFKHQVDDVVIEGRIDRIDLSVREDHPVPVRVVDYKTGDKEVAFWELYYGRAIQLALYLNEALEFLNKTGSQEYEPAGAFYFLADKASLKNVSGSAVEDKLYDNFRLTGLFDYNEFDQDEDIKIPDNKNRTTPKLNSKELKKTLNHSKKVVKDLAGDILSGDISINPIKHKNEIVGCKFCDFKEICRFDEYDKNAKTREVIDLKKTDFMEKLEGEEDE